MVELGQRIARGGAGDLDFFGFGRVIEFDEEHETVELRFGEGIGAFLLDRILRGEDQERLFEGKCFADGSDFIFLHGLEHGGLRFWRGTIDFVGQHDVGKHGTVDEVKFAAPVGRILENVGAGDVHRHEVGRELDAAEMERHGFSHLANEQGFRQAGNAHEQGVTAGKKADAETFDDAVLANDDTGEFRTQAIVGEPELIDRLNVVFAKPLVGYCYDG